MIHTHKKSYNAFLLQKSQSYGISLNISGGDENIFSVTLMLIMIINREADDDGDYNRSCIAITTVVSL